MKYFIKALVIKLNSEVKYIGGDSFGTEQI